MSFLSWQFFAFFAVAAAGFWLARGRVRLWLLLALNLAYAYSWGVSSLAVLCGVTLLTYAAGRMLACAKTTAGRRVWLAVGLICSAGYVFARKASGLLPGAGIQLISAVGVAFYALQAASYLADVYRGSLPVQKSLLHYAVYITFFPRIVSGPIGRAGDFFPQLDALAAGNARPDADKTRRGLLQMLLGYFEKFAVADTLNVFVNAAFAGYTSLGGCVMALAVVVFSFALYLDFAGYSNIAIGAAAVLGFELEANFRRPFLSQSVGELWNRWHISLSRWLRDYIYIPLGGSRHGRLAKWRNLLLTFAVSGLWHGAGWQYLVWGLLHGTFQVVADAARPLKAAFSARYPRLEASAAMRWLRRAFVFALFNAAVLFFRAPSLPAALEIYGFFVKKPLPSQLLDGTLLTLGLDAVGWGIALASLAMLFVYSLRQEHGGDTLSALAKAPALLRVAAALGVSLVTLICIVRLLGGDASGFYYAQF